MSPTQRQPRGSVTTLDALGQRMGKTIPVVLMVWDAGVFADGGVFVYEDIDAVGRQRISFGGEVGVWPDAGELVALAENLGVREAEEGKAWFSVDEVPPHAKGGGRGRGGLHKASSCG